MLIGYIAGALSKRSDSYRRLLVAGVTARTMYATMITWTYLLGYFLGWKYETAIDTTLIGSSSHFEVAIAVAEPSTA